MTQENKARERMQSLKYERGTRTKSQQWPMQSRATRQTNRLCSNLQEMGTCGILKTLVPPHKYLCLPLQEATASMAHAKHNV